MTSLPKTTDSPTLLRYRESKAVVIEESIQEHNQVTMDQPPDNYCGFHSIFTFSVALIISSGIRAIPSSPAGSTTDGGINSAILRYDGAPHNEPTTSANANSALYATFAVAAFFAG